jgi:hypothetical protein
VLFTAKENPNPPHIEEGKTQLQNISKYKIPSMPSKTQI